MKYGAILCNTVQYHVIPCNTIQYHAIPCIIDNCWRSVPLPCGQYNGHFYFSKFLQIRIPELTFELRRGSMKEKWGLSIAFRFSGYDHFSVFQEPFSQIKFWLHQSVNKRSFQVSKKGKLVLHIHSLVPILSFLKRMCREGPGGRVELGVSKVAKFSPAEKVRHSQCSSTFETRWEYSHFSKISNLIDRLGLKLATLWWG